VSHPQRKTIGLRVPDHKVLQELLALHGAPLLATTLIPPGETEAAERPAEIRERFEKQLAAVIGAGPCPTSPPRWSTSRPWAPAATRCWCGRAAARGRAGPLVAG
jgi:tRNA A37 threonylcarbamoyladenosine synthetase subunit TsaC/SUA5/YrdC